MSGWIRCSYELGVCIAVEEIVMDDASEYLVRVELLIQLEYHDRLRLRWWLLQALIARRVSQFFSPERLWKGSPPSERVQERILQRVLG